MVLTPSADIPTAESLVGVACSHSEVTPIPAHYVPLPWQNVPGGHAKTGLRERTWAVCHWLVVFQVGEIVRRGGFVPARNLGQIIAQLPSASPPAAGPTPAGPADEATPERQPEPPPA